jgi:ligand-binding SRPBCC domain-containing protein
MAREHVLRTKTVLPLPIQDVFPFFADAANLERITPPELGFSIDTPPPISMNQGTLIDYTLRLFGIPLRWRTLISEWNPPHSFVDEQLRGPYAQWIHRHLFTADGDRTIMEDEVRYRLPLWPIGDIALPIIKLQLKRIFSFREKAIRELLIDN